MHGGESLSADQTSRRRVLELMAGGGAAAAGALLVGCSSGSHVAAKSHTTVAGPAAANSAPVAAQAGQEIVGAWHGVGIRQDGERSVTMLLFHSDGTFSTLGEDPTRGPSYGTWQRSGDGQVAVTSVNLLYLGGNGAFSGFQRLRLPLTLDATDDLLTTQPGAKVDWYDTAGKYSRTSYPQAGASYSRAAFDGQDAQPLQQLPLGAGS